MLNTFGFRFLIKGLLSELCVPVLNLCVYSKQGVCSKSKG